MPRQLRRQLHPDGPDERQPAQRSTQHGLARARADVDEPRCRRCLELELSRHAALQSALALAEELGLLAPAEEGALEPRLLQALLGSDWPASLRANLQRLQWAAGSVRGTPPVPDGPPIPAEFSEIWPLHLLDIADEEQLSLLRR